MISAATKASYLRATVQAVGNGLKPAAKPAQLKESISVRPNSQSLASLSLHQALPSSANIRVTTGIPGEYKNYLENCTKRIKFSFFRFLRYVTRWVVVDSWYTCVCYCAKCATTADCSLRSYRFSDNSSSNGSYWYSGARFQPLPPQGRWEGKCEEHQRRGKEVIHLLASGR